MIYLCAVVYGPGFELGLIEAETVAEAREKFSEEKSANGLVKVAPVGKTIDIEVEPQ